VNNYYTFCMLTIERLHVPDTINKLYSNYKINEAKTEDPVAPPPLLPFLIQKEAEGRFALLTGFERFMKAKQTKLKELPCYLIASDIAPFTKYTLLASYKRYEPKISLMEEALIIQSGQKELTQKELYNLLTLMGYSGNQHQLREILSLLDMNPEIQQCIHNGVLNLKTIKKLHHLSSADQNTVISLMEQYRLGGSKQSNLINMAIELTKRYKTSFAEVVAQWKDDKEILDTKNIPQQAADLFRYLNKLCYPESIAAEQDFTQRVKQLQLPDALTISHSNAFEVDNCNLTISFKNMDKLEKALPAIRSLVEEQSDSA